MGRYLLFTENELNDGNGWNGEHRVLFCRLDEEMYREIRARAVKDGMTVAAFVEQVLREHLGGVLTASKDLDAERPREPPTKRDVDLEKIEYPPGCNTPEVREALKRWIDYRKQSRKPYKTPEKQLSMLLARYGKEIVEAVDFSIAQGYQGCFLPRVTQIRKQQDAGYVYDPGKPIEPL